MTVLAHQLDRTLVIGAPPALVFRYFTDSSRWAAWWGAGSTIDARPGGRVYIRYPGDVEVVGEVIEVAPPSHIVFTYGFVKGAPVPPGGSRVTIRLQPSLLRPDEDHRVRSVDIESTFALPVRTRSDRIASCVPAERGNLPRAVL